MPGVHRDRVKGGGPRRSPQRVIQLVSAVVLNGYMAGFRKGTIFTGSSKAVCVPVLNCYSCPGALGACPIGALQAAAGGVKHHFPFYVLGLLTLFGVVLGRLACGLLCPFGLVQDLLHHIPVPKMTVPPAGSSMGFYWCLCCCFRLLYQVSRLPISANISAPPGPWAAAFRSCSQTRPCGSWPVCCSPGKPWCWRRWSFSLCWFTGRSAGISAR